MIIGLVTLFATLFFGGSQQYFFIEKLEKGVKEYIEEKDRKKEILSDLKLIKTTIKDFNKDRKKYLKTYHELNASYSATKVEFDSFFSDLTETRKAFQEEVVDQRLEVVRKISSEEWTKIIELSSEVTEKRKNKEAKKKEKDAFEKVKKTINTEITEETTRGDALDALAIVESDFNTLRNELDAVNTLENELLTNKNATVEDALELVTTFNQMREKIHLSIVKFHFSMKDLLPEEQWTKVMRSMNKVLE